MSFAFGEFGEAEAADPMADFLQREKQAAGALLGDDAELFGASGASGAEVDQGAQDFPALDEDALFADAQSGTFESPVLPASDLVSESVMARSDSLGEEVETQAFSAQFPQASDLEQGVVPKEAEPPAPAPVTNEKTPFTYDDLDDESDALRTWRAKQAEDIQRRDAESQRERSEAAAKAEQEIDQFYADYNAQKEKNIRKNKESEARFTEQKQKELTEGTTWTRITKLLDLQNSQSKTIAKLQPGSSDRGRMKELYLALRREGENAPGAAGY